MAVHKDHMLRRQLQQLVRNITAGVLSPTDFGEAMEPAAIAVLASEKGRLHRIGTGLWACYSKMPEVEGRAWRVVLMKRVTRGPSKAGTVMYDLLRKVIREAGFVLDDRDDRVSTDREVLEALPGNIRRTMLKHQGSRVAHDPFLLMITFNEVSDPQAVTRDITQAGVTTRSTMAQNSGIEWTQATWNPTTGCTKVSPGCLNCYAARMAQRLKAMGQRNYQNGFQLTCHEEMLKVPLSWRKPRRVFVDSMSDLFHDAVPEEFILKVFNVMEAARQHTFQVLTKRADRLAALAPRLPWPSNAWMGVSVETAQYASRITKLREVPAAVRFLSLEPLLGPLPNLDLDGIHWVIVGGESGPGARVMHPDWVREIRDTCVASGVPFFFKQWGGTQKKLAGRLLDGRTWDEMPAGTTP